MYKYLINLLFPEICYGCKVELVNNESFICVDCLHNIPLTGFHNSQNNTLLDLLQDFKSIVAVASLFYFHKGSVVQTLIHNLKYKQHQKIGTFLGCWLGEELKHVNQFKSVDVVLPVPIHKRRETQRGYNQVNTFGRALSEQLQANFITNILLKTKHVKSQAFQDKETRQLNMEGVFKLNNPKQLESLHVLLVDDVITTGATIITIVKLLETVPNIKISVAVMAYTEFV